jgi:hypothetical protein
MKQRIIKKDSTGHWRISTDQLEVIPENERNELIEYFREIRFNHHKAGNEVRIDGSTKWSDIDERMSDFYDGWAKYTPI